MWPSFHATNTIIYFWKKFSLNNFILLNFGKVKDLVCFQRHAISSIILIEFIMTFFLLPVNTYVYGNHRKYPTIFGKLRKTVYYAFLDFWKFSKKLRKLLVIFQSSLKSFFKLFLWVLKIFWKIHNAHRSLLDNPALQSAYQIAGTI